MNYPGRIRVVQYGLGPIGLECIRALFRKPAEAIELVGAIDNDPDKFGRTVGELAGVSCDEVVSDEAKSTLHNLQPDVVLHTTGSSLEQVQSQLLQCILAGADVVSSCEELSHLTEQNFLVGYELDQAAINFGVTLFGTGVNPGYAMDVLALTATGVCTRVNSVKVVRRVDAGKRRLPLQKKVGAGLSCEDFEALADKMEIGHAGLRESCLMVMKGLGIEEGYVRQTVKPVIATATVETSDLTIQRGQVAGIHQVAVAHKYGREVVSLELYMYVGADNPTDLIMVDGDPPIRMEIEGGIHGDTATVGALINAIPLVSASEAGLISALDMPIPRCFLP